MTTLLWCVLLVVVLLVMRVECLSVGQVDLFESPIVPNTCCASLSSFPSNSTLWRASTMNLVGYALAGSTWKPAWGTADGSQFLYIKGTPSTFAYTNLTELIVGSHYTVSFMYGVRNQNAANMDLWFNVTIDNENVFSVRLNALTTWLSQTSSSFKATKSIQTLYFKAWSVSGADHSIVIDRVGLNQIGLKPQSPSSFESPTVDMYLYARDDISQTLRYNTQLLWEFCDNCGISSTNTLMDTKLTTQTKYGNQFAFLQTNSSLTNANIVTHLFNTSESSYYSAIFSYAFSCTTQSRNVKLSVKVNGMTLFQKTLTSVQEWTDIESVPFKVSTIPTIISVEASNLNSDALNDFVLIDGFEIVTVGLTLSQLISFDEFDLSSKGYLSSSDLTLPSFSTPVIFSLNGGLSSNSYYKPFSSLSTTDAEERSFAYLSTSVGFPVANITFQSYGLLTTLKYTLSMKISTTQNDDTSYLTVYAEDLAIYQSPLFNFTSWTTISSIPFQTNTSIVNFKVIINNVDGKNRVTLIDALSFDSYPKPTVLTDYVIFGDVDSESKHSFSGSLSLNGTTSSQTMPLAYDQIVSYRQIGPDYNVANNAVPSVPNSFLNFTIGVHPTKLNYITIKVYGSDAQNGAIFIFWKPKVSSIKMSNYPGSYLLASDVLMLGNYNGGAASKGFGTIDFVDGSEGPATRKFYYATTLLPTYMTANMTNITIMLGGFTTVGGYSDYSLLDLETALKPIYRVYSHVEPFFTPYYSPNNIRQSLDSKFDVATVEPDEKPAIPLTSSGMVTNSQILANITALKTSFDSQLAYLMSNQLYGSSWNASLDIWNSSNPYAVPQELYGAPSVPFAFTPTSQLTRSEWLIKGQYWSTNSNNGPLNMLAVFARVYKNSWSSYANNSELLDRVLVGVDYYARQQGSNGAFLSTSLTLPWCGAPNRNTGCGNALDGGGPYSLGISIGLLIDEFTQLGHLEKTVNLSLNSNVTTRREAWWNMLYNSAIGTIARTRGGCANQDMSQIIGLMGSVYGGKKLYPNRTIIEEDILQYYIDQAIGFQDQARNPSHGPFFSENGVIMECSGVKGTGGLDFNYGSLGIHLSTIIAKMSQLLNLSNTTMYNQGSLNATRHQAKYVYQEWVENSYPNSLSSTVLKKPTSINTRIEHGPDKDADNEFACWFQVAKFNDPLCARIMYHFMLRNSWPTSYTSWYIPFPALAHDAWAFVDDFIEASTKIANSQVVDEILPSELKYIDSNGKIVSTENRAFVEVALPAVYIRNDNEILVINVNRRHSAGEVTGYAQVLQITPQTRRQTFIKLNNTDGFDGLYEFKFGKYHIAINRQSSIYYPFNNMTISSSELLYDQVIDLVSGNVYNLRLESVRNSFNLEPRSAIVLVAAQPWLTPITNFVVNLKCFSISSNSQSVCSGRGSCLQPDICLCQTGYSGSNCELIKCFGVLSNEASVCSGNGQCEKPDTCKCNAGYQGSNCYNFGTVSEGFSAQRSTLVLALALLLCLLITLL